MDARGALDLRIESLYERFARYGLRAYNTSRREKESVAEDPVRDFLESGFFETDNPLISDACEAVLRMKMVRSSPGASN
jgi:hypothetical protein